MAVLSVVTGLGSPVWLIGGLAAAIVVFEGAQHLYQLQEDWIGYRSTAEALKHERYLYLARAGPYVGEDRRRVLAERIEGWSPKSTPSGPAASSQPNGLQCSHESVALPAALSWQVPRVLLDRADPDRRGRGHGPQEPKRQLGCGGALCCPGSLGVGR